MRITERLYWTTGQARLVPEGHAEAAFLAFIVGDEVTEHRARMLGLKGGTIPSPVSPQKGPAKPGSGK